MVPCEFMMDTGHDIKHMGILIGSTLPEIRQVNNIFGSLSGKGNGTGVGNIVQLINGSLNACNSFW